MDKDLPPQRQLPPQPHTPSSSTTWSQTIWTSSNTRVSTLASYSQLPSVWIMCLVQLAAFRRKTIFKDYTPFIRHLFISLANPTEFSRQHWVCKPGNWHQARDLWELLVRGNPMALAMYLMTGDGNPLVYTHLLLVSGVKQLCDQGDEWHVISLNSDT